MYVNNTSIKNKFKRMFPLYYTINQLNHFVNYELFTNHKDVSVLIVLNHISHTDPALHILNIQVYLLLAMAVTQKSLKSQLAKLKSVKIKKHYH